MYRLTCRMPDARYESKMKEGKLGRTDFAD